MSRVLIKHIKDIISLIKQAIKIKTEFFKGKKLIRVVIRLYPYIKYYNKYRNHNIKAQSQ